MIEVANLPQFAEAYSKEGFQRWFDVCLSWIERNKLPATVEVLERLKCGEYRHEFYFRVKMADSEGGYFASLFKPSDKTDETDADFQKRIEKKCSDEMVAAKKARIAAFSHRQAAAGKAYDTTTIERESA